MVWASPKNTVGMKAYVNCDYILIPLLDVIYGVFVSDEFRIVVRYHIRSGWWYRKCFHELPVAFGRLWYCVQIYVLNTANKFYRILWYNQNDFNRSKKNNQIMHIFDTFIITLLFCKMFANCYSLWHTLSCVNVSVLQFQVLAQMVLVPTPPRRRQLL